MPCINSCKFTRSACSAWLLANRLPVNVRVPVTHSASASASPDQFHKAILINKPEWNSMTLAPKFSPPHKQLFATPRSLHFLSKCFLPPACFLPQVKHTSALRIGHSKFSEISGKIFAAGFFKVNMHLSWSVFIFSAIRCTQQVAYCCWSCVEFQS